LGRVFAGRVRSSKRFPNLADYLKKVVERRLSRVQRLSNAIGCGLVSLTTPLAGLAFGVGFASLGVGLLAATLAMPLSVYAWYLIDKRLRRPRSPEEAKRMEAWKAAASLLSVEQQRRLHKLMDPTMSQLLEAAAYHYVRIDAALSNETWSRESLPAHWRSVKSQAQEAADQAMEELVMLAMPCMGEPQADRGSAFKEAVEDMFDMDFMIAIGNLKDLATADWTKFAHRSPHAPVAFTAGRHTAEKLKKLADEIEKQTAQAVVETGTMIEVGTAADSIDVVLSEIHAVKEAEDELQQRVQEGS
jgi:hypothetical protein